MTKPFVLVPRNTPEASMLMVHDHRRDSLTAFYPGGFEGIWMDEVLRFHENMETRPSKVFEVIPIESMRPRRE